MRHRLKKTYQGHLDRKKVYEDISKQLLDINVRNLVGCLFLRGQSEHSGLELRVLIRKGLWQLSSDSEAIMTANIKQNSYHRGVLSEAHAILELLASYDPPKDCYK